MVKGVVDVVALLVVRIRRVVLHLHGVGFGGHHLGGDVGCRFGRGLLRRSFGSGCGSGRRGGLRGKRCLGLRRCGTQEDAAIVCARLDAAGNLAFCDTCQHLGVRLRRFSAKVTVIAGQIAEILGNGFHCVERIVKPFQRAREGAVGDR